LGEFERKPRFARTEIKNPEKKLNVKKDSSHDSKCLCHLMTVT